MFRCRRKKISGRRYSVGPSVDDHGGDTRFEQATELCSAHWPAQKVALAFLAVLRLEISDLFLGFDALCNDNVPKISPHGNNRGNDC